MMTYPVVVAALLLAPMARAEGEDWHNYLGAEFSPLSRYRGFAPGGGVNIGIYRISPLQWETNFSNQVTNAGPEFRRSEWRWALRAKYAVSGTLHLLAGVRLQQEQYRYKNVTTDLVNNGSDVSYGFIGTYAWEKLSLGPEFGIGNRWVFNKIYLSFEWFELYAPLATLSSTYTTAPRSTSNATPSPYGLQLGVLQAGMLF